MEVIKCISKNGQYVHLSDDGAFNAEQEIALIEVENEFDYAFSVGCEKIYNRTTKYKILYPFGYYNIAWDYIKSVKGNLETHDTKFEEVMSNEGLTDLLGNVRINRINFNIKTVTNGRNCDDCLC